MTSKNFIFLLALLFSIGIRAERTPIKPDLYYTGAAVGMFMGFGIGQAIQGRYKETGWIFTTSELSSLAIITAGVIWAGVETSRNYAADKKPHMYIPVGGLVMIFAGAILGGAFRVWDIIDLWACARPSDR